MQHIDFSKYVLPRSRHHVSPNLYIPAHELQTDLSYYPPLFERVNWADFFATGNAPKVLDIGCGLGRFTMEFAINHPEENVLGIEVRKGIVEWAEHVIHEERIANARVMWYSVVNGVPFIRDESVRLITYFFPDPWYKKRHVKRRAFTAQFLDECARMLEPRGVFLVQTDVPEVHQYHLEILHAHSGFDITDASPHLEHGDALWHKHAARVGEDFSSESTLRIPRTHQEETCLRNHIPYERLVCVKK